AITLRSGRALEDVGNKVHVQPTMEKGKDDVTKETKIQQPQHVPKAIEKPAKKEENIPFPQQLRKEGSRDSTNSMASSSSTVSVFDAHRFRTAHNEQLFDSYARRRKVIPEVGFNLEDDEYPEIIEQIALRGWRRLAAPRTDISKLLVQEFYANA
ncbi:hypothetical protein PIB30_114219, partial [Stylosanthes scabra]|nr:hypothetical protein [Stylosanthes scabra]